MTFEEINGMTFLEFLRKCKEAGAEVKAEEEQEEGQEKEKDD